MSSQGSCSITATLPALSIAFASAIACGDASFSTSKPARAFPPSAPSAAATGNPTIPVPGTVTPMPFFIRFGETHASMRSTAPSSSEEATAAARAREIGSVQPNAGLTSSCTARIKLSHNGFNVVSNITTTFAQISQENARNGETHNSRPVKIIRYREAPLYLCSAGTL